MFVSALLTCIVLRAFSAQAKVDDDFDCKIFFYKDTEPGGMDQNAKKICQWTANFGPHYATLYSVHHKIPLYSAYRFDMDCFTDGGRISYWHLEPQLSKPEDPHYMVREKQRSKNAYKGTQATSDDYSETGYDRGHLNPNSFQCGEGRIATFALTNAAPMDACFNRNVWGKWEKNLRTFLRDKLRSDGGFATIYIVTGTVPDESIRIPQREISEEPERVTVPSHIWTAVCYEHYDERKSFSFGYMGENKPEGNINLMSVSDLNNQLSGISIFKDDCFHDNNKLDAVKVKFQTLINQQIKEIQGVQMSSGVQNTYLAMRKAADGNTVPEKKFKVSEMTVKLAFDTMSSYFDVAKDLKISAGSACLITNVKPLVVYEKTGRIDLRKRDVAGVSDAVECLLVPEKQMTAADGSPCSSISESIYGCQCHINDKTKSCCSTPCLHQDNLNSYMCYSGQTQIECSPRYSLVTHKGEKCLDNHPCATYGYDYYWCYTVYGWDYCSPPLWRSKAKNGKYCRSGHACAKYGSGRMWCYMDDKGTYSDCCTSDDCFSAVNGQTCRSDHKCGYYEKWDFLWCYTDFKNNWDYCCKSC